jgi:hypothetical protein
VPWAVFKGPMLAEVIYDRANRRSYVDIDILIDRRSMGAVLEALEGAGSEPVDRNWKLIRSGRRGEMNIALPNGTMLDLHWHLFNARRLRRSFPIDIDVALSRVRDFRIEGAMVPTLDPVDTLLHLAAHAALAGGHRLSWCKDLEQAVRNDTPDWDELVARAEASGLALMTAIMLGRSRRVLGAPVPDDVLDRLAPRGGWRALIRVADRLSPPQRAFGHQLTARTAVAATRRSTFGSAIELGRSVGMDVIWPVLSDERSYWRRRMQGKPPLPPRPNPLHVDVDGGERAAYLDALERGAPL